MKQSKRFILCIFVLFISLSAISLTSANSSAAVPVLAQELTCRINFNAGVLNSMISLDSSNSSSLQQAVTTLQDDLSQVSSLGNNTQVQNFVKSQYQSDMRNVISAAQSWRDARKGLTLSERASLVSSYRQLQASYAQCEQQVSQSIAQERTQGYQAQLAVFQNRTDELSEKGFNVTSLNQLLQNAQTQIIQPLQNALSSANNTQSVQAAVRSYCLYDGCTNGTNFHLDAKFDIERASIILTALQANASAFNLSNATLSQAQQYLSNAQSTLDSVGTSAYQQGQSQTIFSNVQNATKLIVQLITQAMKEPVGGLK